MACFRDYSRVVRCCWAHASANSFGWLPWYCLSRELTRIRSCSNVDCTVKLTGTTGDLFHHEAISEHISKATKNIPSTLLSSLDSLITTYIQLFVFRMNRHSAGVASKDSDVQWAAVGKFPQVRVNQWHIPVHNSITTAQSLTTILAPWPRDLGGEFTQFLSPLWDNLISISLPTTQIPTVLICT